MQLTLKFSSIFSMDKFIHTLVYDIGLLEPQVILYSRRNIKDQGVCSDNQYETMQSL